MTVQDYLDLGYSKSKKNVPGRIVAESTEGVSLVNRIVRMFCQIGVRINPAYFMGKEDVEYAEDESAIGDGWVRPSQAEAVLLITQEDGAEVSVVPWNDRTAEEKKPSVYRMNKIYMPAGNATDPDTDETLTFWFAARPLDADDPEDEVDPLFPDAYAELVGFELAIIFAKKDGRPDDLPGLVSERDAWLRMFIHYLEHETMNEVQRWETRFNIPSATPILSQLAGGTSVELSGGGA